ncbi:MAG: hypothetical protein KatS3mg105_5110 [Gemmatales bacterium]|nr:MAG: hypothetical protein KatS3mg105_5110 [Gemmatales bacterium]
MKIPFAPVTPSRWKLRIVSKLAYVLVHAVDRLHPKNNQNIARLNLLVRHTPQVQVLVSNGKGGKVGGFTPAVS